MPYGNLVLRDKNVFRRAKASRMHCDWKESSIDSEQHNIVVW